MIKEKITIQDIADSLGISRNTASKALNGNDSVPTSTRDKVIKKAIELKYKQFAMMETDTALVKNTGNIALITSNLPNISHFGSMLLSGLEKKVSSQGYNLSIHIVREADIDALTMPNNFEPRNVDGIICIEMFDKAYSELISSLAIPTIFIDCSSEIEFHSLQADLLLMENEHSIRSIVKTIIDNGRNRIGFVGDFTHCRSFNERWIGFKRTLDEYQISLDLDVCIVEKDMYFDLESDWMDVQLSRITQLPSALICANDFIAARVIRGLKNLGVDIPQDVVVVGFDDAPQSRITDPQLTTVHIFNNDMGIIAAEMLLSRINAPSKPYQIVHVQTKPIYRDSTGNMHLLESVAEIHG